MLSNNRVVRNQPDKKDQLVDEPIAHENGMNNHCLPMTASVIMWQNFLYFTKQYNEPHRISWQLIRMAVIESVSGSICNVSQYQTVEAIIWQNW